MEILGNAIRNHDQIKGIRVLGTECKLSQYADDTILILDGSDNSVHQSFSLLDSFAAVSGLRACLHGRRVPRLTELPG